MANEQNLIPHQYASGKEARDAGRKGGIASAEARRKKKACADIAMRIINAELTGKRKSEVEKLVGPLEDDESSLYAAAFAKLVSQALKGNVKAFKEMQEVIDKAQGAGSTMQREDDPLSKSLKEIAEGL